MDHTERRTDSGHAGVREVVASTIMAAHRRDHEHAVGNGCHPHAVEVVHLGDRAFMICHDCRHNSGLLPHRQAGQLANEHRRQTREPHAA
jgi:hypothetical protein